MVIFECFFVEMFLSISIFSLTIFGVSLTVFGRRFRNNYPLVMSSLCDASTFILVCALVLLFSLQSPNKIILSGLFIFDNLVFWGKVFLLGGTICVLSVIKPLLKKNHVNRFEILILILSIVLGLIFLLSANDFLTLFLAVEMQSLGLYVLAASKKDSTFSIEAGLKYYLLGSLASTFFLFGAFLIYATFGTTNFGALSIITSNALPIVHSKLLIVASSPYIDFHKLLDDPIVLTHLFPNRVEYTKANLVEMVYISFFFLSFFFFFKLGAAPLHNWVPDVYEGAPIGVSVFFAVIPKFALFSCFIRVLTLFWPYSSCSDLFVFHDFLFLCGLLSVFLGVFYALAQKRLKRLLAYGSIAHVGLMLLSISTFTPQGFFSFFLYIIFYSLMTFLFWGIVVSHYTNEGEEDSKTLADFTGLATYNPVLAFSALCILFSFIGMPPFCGFFSKFYVFCSLVLYKTTLFRSCIVVLLGVFSSFYYLRLIKVIYFDKSEMEHFVEELSFSSSILLGIGTFLLFFFFLNPNVPAYIALSLSLVFF